MWEIAASRKSKIDGTHGERTAIPVTGEQT